MKARTAAPLELNLATRPVRNRRFFRLFRSVLVILLLASAGLIVYTLLVYGAESARLRASRAELESLVRDAQRERTRLISDVVVGRVDVRGIEVPEVDQQTNYEYYPNDLQSAVCDQEAEIAR